MFHEDLSQWADWNTDGWARVQREGALMWWLIIAAVMAACAGTIVGYVIAKVFG